MHSGFEIPGIHHRQQQQQQQQEQAGDNNCAPVLLSMNQTHLLEQIHTLPATQQLFLDQHHFLPPHHHHYGGGAASSPAFLPVNFKLGLNEICTRNNYNDCCVSSSINEGEDALVRGSEQYEVPEARHYSSLGMLHCNWQNQEDSAIKQQPFWEPLPSEVSNENSEIVDRQENLEMNQKEALTNCLESKSRVHFGELEAIYKRLGTSDSHQTRPIEPVNTHLPVGFDHGSDANSIGDQEVKNARKKRKKKKKEKSYNQMINPMSEFVENLVKQVIDHQENLHKKFIEMIERLDVERREREETWRHQELAHFEQEASERANERFLAESREATIVSYLEKITGEKINLPTIFKPTEIINSSNKSDDFDHESDGARKGPC